MDLMNIQAVVQVAFIFLSRPSSVCITFKLFVVRYQRPLNVTGKRKTPNVKRNGRNHERKCEKYVGSKPLNEPSGRSSSNTQNKEKIPKTKRFRSSHDK